ncbi:MAG: DUF937 domain-containing protein [Variovorax sp.]|nr:MAG: DUF937 domain-containing protein [Variovorax sp.]
MGLLDSVLGQVLGGGQGASATPSGPAETGHPGGGLGGLGGLGAILGSLLANDGGQGGLGGLVSKFERAGMGDVIGSWIGKGDNRPVSEGQLGNVLGGDVVSGLAQKLGMNAGTLLPLLASLLPMLIDRLTPQGQMPANGLGDLSELGGMGGFGASGQGDTGTGPAAGDAPRSTPGSESELLASLSALLQKR